MDIKRDILFDLDKIVNYLKPYREYANTEYNWRVPLEVELLDGLNNGVFNSSQYNKIDWGKEPV